MEPDLLQKLEELDKKIEMTYRSAEKMRKYFLWTLIISVLVIVVPAIGLVFAIPAFLNTLNFSGLGL